MRADLGGDALEKRVTPRRKRTPRPSLRFERDAGCVVCGVDEVGCAPFEGELLGVRSDLPGAEEAIYMIQVADAIFESIDSRRAVAL